MGREIVDFEAMSEKGLFLICGKTGTGKTMILDAMTFALYGKSSGHSRDDFEAMRCTNAAFEQTTYVKFEFENNGEYFLFERRLERKRKNLSASYNVMQRDEDGILRDDKIVMDVTSLFLTFSIDCVNYKNMDVYIRFLNNYIKAFLENDKYIVIQRIGVRKLGGDVFRSFEDCSGTFESSVFAPLDVAILDGGLIDREYVDRIIKKDDTVKVNFARRCRAIKTDDGETVYQSLLDIDGYVDKGLIEKNNYRFPNDFENVVKTKINDYLFELYKSSVTEQYLKDNGEEVQN